MWASSCSVHHHGLPLHFPCASPKLSPPATSTTQMILKEQLLASPQFSLCCLSFCMQKNGVFVGYNQYCSIYALKRLTVWWERKHECKSSCEKNHEETSLGSSAEYRKKWTYWFQNGRCDPHIRSVVVGIWMVWKVPWSNFLKFASTSKHEKVVSPNI